jgi:hypothetical protein
MRSISWKKIARSWWGRMLIGAFIGGLLVAFANIREPVMFIGGMFVGAFAMYFLGMWE